VALGFRHIAKSTFEQQTEPSMFLSPTEASSHATERPHTRAVAKATV